MHLNKLASRCGVGAISNFRLKSIVSIVVALICICNKLNAMFTAKKEQYTIVNSYFIDFVNSILLTKWSISTVI